MNRVVGIETEYGCLVSGETVHGPDAWPTRVKNYLFKKAKAGVIDLHYRDYEEPPGNGGFLLNGGRLYIDMGHLEYSSPECRTVEDSVSYDLAGDQLLQSALEALGVSEEVAFIKNNVDHHTGATFGCHENYLMKRELQFSPRLLGTLLSFLATRQLFTGAGRVGQASPLAFDFEPAPSAGAVPFQLSQRADHIVNDIYQWVQFNRAIINARDEPLADYRKYRRLHLLIGDSNMSPFATALKVGTTALILTLLEEGSLPDDVILLDAVLATRQISHEGTGHAVVQLEDGRTRSALDIQREFLAHAQQALGGRDEETNWILETWAYTLDALASKPELLLGGVDWISKKWLLETFRESEGLSWQDPWLQSLDLEYHNINPAKGLFFALTAAKGIGEFNQRLRRPAAMMHPPADTRACGRGHAVSIFQDRKLPYVINWDSISLDNTPYLPMPDPFETYTGQVKTLLEAPLEPLG
ncbi:MAG: proteasome accessory factor PafA2 family protein [Chthoniobacter sp.]|nr:proteasome accessory factor PafA2 family protein [Chthoniobacter sp.]